MMKSFLFMLITLLSSTATALTLQCRNDQTVPRFNLQIRQPNPSMPPLGVLRTDAGPFANLTCGNLISNVLNEHDSICSGVYANDSDPKTPGEYFETPISINLIHSIDGWTASFALPVYFGGGDAQVYCQVLR
jgi:hypothetical protein